MSKLTKDTRGQACEIRAPGICIDGDHSTTVPAHYRLSDLCGIGMRPNDLISARACAACHDLADGRIPRGEFSKLEVRLMHAEGVIRTIDKLWRAGKIKVV